MNTADATIMGMQAVRGTAVAFPGAEAAGVRTSQEAAVFVILLTKTDHRPL